MRLERPERANLPRILTEAMRRAEGIVSARSKFRELGGRQLRLIGPQNRERRSERLEAIALVAKALLCRMDLVSLRVGDIAANDRCRGVTMYTIGKWTRLGDRRVDRALADLRDAGYLRSEQPRKSFRRDIGVAYMGLPAVRTFTSKFFDRCGLGLSLELERKKAVQRRRTSPVVDLRAARELRRIARPQLQAAKSAQAAKMDDERGKRLAELLLALRREHPDWSADQVRAEARRQLE